MFFVIIDESSCSLTVVLKIILTEGLYFSLLQAQQLVCSPGILCQTQKLLPYFSNVMTTSGNTQSSTYLNLGQPKQMSTEKYKDFGY